MLSSLTFDWISNPILNEDTSFPVLSSIGRVVERPARRERPERRERRSHQEDQKGE